MADAAIKTHRGIHSSGRDKVSGAIIYILLALFVIIELYPMIFVLSASLSDPKLVAAGKMVLWPVKPSLSGYQYILSYSDIWTGYANTVFYTVVGTVLNLAVTLPAAYALSRRDFKDKGIFMIFFMITMYFSGGTIPSYLNIYNFGLLNTRWVLLINGALSVYNLIVARTFFASTIPWELHEAARIDGAGNFRTFFQIVLPLSSPIIVVMALYYGVGHWNEYFSAMIYQPRARAIWPLQLFLRELLMMSKFTTDAMLGNNNMSAEEMSALVKQADTANMIKYCVIVAATAPMLIAYPWLQKFFAKGVMIGSVKG